jgi:DNA integrity scanning protein DisA with diadenylate cyclase activity
MRGGTHMEHDLENIKESIKEIRESIKEINNNVNSLRVLIVGSYITKNEFAEEAGRNNQVHNMFTNSLILISITLVSVFGYFIIKGL